MRIRGLVIELFLVIEPNVNGLLSITTRLLQSYFQFLEFI